MRCDICRNNIAETFLKKIMGTQVRTRGKRHNVCFECQKKFPDKQALLAQLSK